MSASTFDKAVIKIISGRPTLCPIHTTSDSGSHHVEASITIPGRSLCSSSIDEAQMLVRRCAEPRPTGDLVKAAIHRASRQLNWPFSRTREIWYGNARRIDAQEMDRLRQAAPRTVFTNTIAGTETVCNRTLTSPSEAALNTSCDRQSMP